MSAISGPGENFLLGLRMPTFLLYSYVSFPGCICVQRERERERYVHVEREGERASSEAMSPGSVPACLLL